MMPSELSRICRLAKAIGPLGSSTPSLQPPSIAAAARTTASATYRMSDLPRAEVDETAHGPDGAWREFGMHRSDGPAAMPRTSVLNQEGRKQCEQIEDGECEQPLSSAAVGPGAPADPPCEQQENRAAN